jgi:hypothetical protein
VSFILETGKLEESYYEKSFSQFYSETLNGIIYRFDQHFKLINDRKSQQILNRIKDYFAYLKKVIKLSK